MGFLYLVTSLGRGLSERFPSSRIDRFVNKCCSRQQVLSKPCPSRHLLIGRVPRQASKHGSFFRVFQPPFCCFHSAKNGCYKLPPFERWDTPYPPCKTKRNIINLDCNYLALSSWLFFALYIAIYNSSQTMNFTNICFKNKNKNKKNKIKNKTHK